MRILSNETTLKQYDPVLLKLVVCPNSTKTLVLSKRHPTYYRPPREPKPWQSCHQPQPPGKHQLLLKPGNSSVFLWFSNLGTYPVQFGNPLVPMVRPSVVSEVVTITDPSCVCPRQVNLCCWALDSQWAMQCQSANRKLHEKFDFWPFLHHT